MLISFRLLLAAPAAIVFLMMAHNDVIAATSGSKPGGKIENELKNFLQGVEKNKPLPMPIAPGGKDPHGKLDEEKLLTLALQHLYAGKEAEAVKTLDMGISRNPRFHKFYGLRASIHLSKSRFGSALGDLKEALALNPDDAMLLVHRALAYRGFGSNQQALADLNRAIELKPDMMTAWYNRAALNVKLNQMELAVKDFRKAASIAPKEPAPSFNLAMGLHSLGRKQEAIAEMKRLQGFAPSAEWKRMAASQLKKWNLGKEADEKMPNPHAKKKPAPPHKANNSAKK